MELEALWEARVSLSNATTWSDKPEIYRPLSEGADRLYAWLERVSEGPSMVVKEFATKELSLSGTRVRGVRGVRGIGGQGLVSIPSQEASYPMYMIPIP